MPQDPSAGRPAPLEVAARLASDRAVSRADIAARLPYTPDDWKAQLGDPGDEGFRIVTHAADALVFEGRCPKRGDAILAASALPLLTFARRMERFLADPDAASSPERREKAYRAARSVIARAAGMTADELTAIDGGPDR